MVASVAEALQALEASAFDLLITDMTMPQMTGAELVREILALRSQVAIVLCTGFSELIDEQKAAAIGAHAFLMKPFHKQELAQVVRDALDYQKCCKEKTARRPLASAGGTA